MMPVIVKQETFVPNGFNIAEQLVGPRRMGQSFPGHEAASDWASEEVKKFREHGYNAEGDFLWGRDEDGHGIRFEVRPQLAIIPK